jgi:hypothetical protein
LPRFRFRAQSSLQLFSLVTGPGEKAKSLNHTPALVEIPKPVWHTAKNQSTQNKIINTIEVNFVITAAALVKKKTIKMPLPRSKLCDDQEDLKS